MEAATKEKYNDIKVWFNNLFELSESKLNGQKNYPIHAIRTTAIKHLQQIDFPTRSVEEWKYTSVTPLLQHDYKEAIPYKLSEKKLHYFKYKKLDTHLLVFVNGIFNENLSHIEHLPKGVEIMNMGSALTDKRFKHTAYVYLSKLATTEQNAFIVINTAFAKNGIFVYVSPHTVVEKPIHLLHIGSAKKDPLMITPQCLILAEDNSELSLIETYHGSSDNSGIYFTNAVNQFIAGKNAHIKHYRLQNESETAFHINNTQIIQERDSVYSSYAFDLGSNLVRNNLSSQLNGQGTSTNLHGVYLAHNKQHIDNHTFIDHAHAHCNSNELYKGIITDNAKGVFNGKIIVRQDAQKTNAFQQNNNLVLSKTATMDSKPQLEIFADDVKCSHGATIGQLEEEAVYYLRSRGLSNEQAQSILQHAFLKEVVDRIPLSPIRKSIDKLIVEKLTKSTANALNNLN